MTRHRLPTLLLTLAAALTAGTGTAAAGWGPPVAASPVGRDVALLGVAAPGDRPAVLLDAHAGGAHRLQLRTTARAGGPLGATITLARGRASFEGAGLSAGRDGDLVAAWLELVNGSRRPVVATGPRLADRQVLAPGPRSTQFLAFAADRRGDAVVAYWRYRGNLGAQVFAAYRPAGGRFGMPELVSTGGGYPSSPAVAIDQDGRAGVAWSDASGVHVAERAPGASAFAAGATVPGSSRAASSPPGLAEDGGGAVVAWSEGPRNAGSIMASRRGAGSPTWAVPAKLSAAGVRIPHYASPQVALDGRRALVTWVDGVPHTVAHDRAELAVSADAGASWSPPVRRAVPAPARAIDATLLPAAPGRLAQLLITTSRRVCDVLQTATIRTDGTLGPARAIGVPLGRGPLAAQGARRTWLGLDRWNGRTNQALLVSSSS